MLLENHDNSKDLTQFMNDHIDVDLSEKTVFAIFSQLVDVVWNLKKIGVCHCDLKLDNILIDVKSYQLHLIDFGSAQEFTNKTVRYISGTDVYLPPEWHTQQYCFHDGLTVWSLGILLYCLLEGDLPFDTVEEVVSKPCLIKRDLSTYFKNILERTLDKFLAERMTLCELYDGTC